MMKFMVKHMVKHQNIHLHNEAQDEEHNTTHDDGRLSKEWWGKSSGGLAHGVTWRAHVEKWRIQLWVIVAQVYFNLAPHWAPIVVKWMVYIEEPLHIVLCPSQCWTNKHKYWDRSQVVHFIEEMLKCSCRMTAYSQWSTWITKSLSAKSPRATQSLLKNKWNKIKIIDKPNQQLTFNDKWQTTKP